MLDIIKTDLYKNPNKSLLIAARYANLVLGKHRPDWIEALANGNTEKWPAVCAVARELVEADNPGLKSGASEEKPGGLMAPQKGQSLTEMALGMVVLALIVFAIVGLMQSPAGQQMAAWAAQGMSNILAEAAVAAPAVDQGRSHAFKHGQEAISADECFARYKVVQQWRRPADGYKANVCYLGMQFFIQIVDETGGEVTKFQRKEARSLGDVGKYLRDTGYRK